MKVLVLFDLERPPKPDEKFTLRKLEYTEDRIMEADVIRSLKRIGHDVQVLPVFENVKAMVDKVYDWAPDVVFNMVESFYGYRWNEPNVPALLELLNVHYTGCGPEPLLLCKDKALAKKVLSYHRVPTAHFMISKRKRPLRRLRRFKFPAFVKPVGEEGSDGIAKASFARTEEEAIARARFIHENLQTDALIEEYIEGREIYVSVLGNYRLTIFPPRELHFGKIPDDEPRFATAKAKWDFDYRKKWEIDNRPAADLPEGVRKKLEHITRRVYRVLNLRGFARLDVRVTPDGQVFVLEANPNPSLALEDDYAQSAADAGMSYDELIGKILALA
jgi:D-alanine-D-alanine ligase